MFILHCTCLNREQNSSAEPKRMNERVYFTKIHKLMLWMEEVFNEIFLPLVDIPLWTASSYRSLFTLRLSYHILNRDEWFTIWRDNKCNFNVKITTECQIWLIKMGAIVFQHCSLNLNNFKWKTNRQKVLNRCANV